MIKSAQVALLVLIVLVPFNTRAQSNLGADADAMCNAKCAQQAALAKKYKNPELACPLSGKKIISCQASGSMMGGSVTGYCIENGGCKATSASGTDGKSINVGDLSKLLSGISQLVQSLGGMGGGAGGGSGGAGTGSGGTGCTQYYQVSTPSSDPCAYYVPQTSNSINSNIDTSGTGTGGNGSGSSASDLINAISGTGDSGSTNNSTNTNANTNTNTATSVSSTISNGATSSTVLFNRQQNTLAPGVSGDIRIIQNGATIIVSNPDVQKNSVVAGFLGTNGTGAQPQGIVQSWCQNRPWASNFLSFIIPASFFDGLCTLRGYRVGQLAPSATTTKPSISLTQTSITRKPVTKPATTTVTASTTQVFTLPAPQADIWAVPAAVPLGTRATVYWSSKNAVSCLVTSPDGSFSHTALSGGGATVPLAGPTTFTISCDSSDGQHATDFVTVRLSL